MRNPLHSICPYFAMFPESFVQKQLLAYSRPGDQVFDPFCGRGTAVLESLLNDRPAIGADINPVAACISGAKAHVPELTEVVSRLETLREEFACSQGIAPPDHEFFGLCFSELTLQQVLFLRTKLRWQSDYVDRFIAAVALGVLHGESHRTALCLSNRMPRTISTKPDYSVRWWKSRSLMPPVRDTFEILIRTSQFRYTGNMPNISGKVVLGDSRYASELLSQFEGKVALVVTSPPYLDTTDYAEDQWLRLWFLGGADKPMLRINRDDRHTDPKQYWRFISEVWSGCSRLLGEGCRIVVRIGGSMLEKGDLFVGLRESLEGGVAGRSIRPLHEGETSLIRRRQTNSFRPGAGKERVEHDFAFAVDV